MGSAVVQEAWAIPNVRAAVRSDLGTPQELKDYLDSDVGKKAFVVMVYWIVLPKDYAFVENYDVVSLEQDSRELSQKWIEWESELRNEAV